MHFEDATKRQLLQIAFYEDCSLDDKYQAAAELQMRQWHDDYLMDLVRLWGQGKSAFEIAIELGISYHAVMYRLTKYKMFRRRVS
jgi:hypothetical protein